MDKARQEQLFQSFPELFDDGPDAPITQWGIEVKDGWYDIVVQLCKDLEILRITRKSDTPKIRQLKSKFGQLTIYLSDSDEVVEKIVANAVDHASHTCEDCGAPGELYRNRNRWYFIACTKHAGYAERVEKS
jgi:hypothetical protein